MTPRSRTWRCTRKSSAALAIERYLSRDAGPVPYGKGAALAHVVGSDQGGGYEWRADAPSR